MKRWLPCVEVVLPRSRMQTWQAGGRAILLPCPVTLRKVLSVFAFIKDSILSFCALRLIDTVHRFPIRTVLIWYLGCGRGKPCLVICWSHQERNTLDLCSVFFLWLVSLGLRLRWHFMKWVRNYSVELCPKLPPTLKWAAMFVAKCESWCNVPRQIMSLLTKHHRGTLRREGTTPAFQECHPPTFPIQSWRAAPIWVPWLNPEVEMLESVTMVRTTSEEPCSAPPTPVTPHCGDRNKSGVSNLGTCIYLKRISWRENKRLLSLQSWEEREVHLRLLQMKQQGSEEQETSACVRHSSLLRQVYEGMECL